MAEAARQIRVRDIKEKKRRGEKIAMLTVYDATMARLLDRAGIDIFLVGDSLGMVIQGHPTTLPVTLEAILHHTEAVARGTHRALVVADMPFLSYQVSVSEAVRSAGRLIQQGGAAAVKLEGGRPVLEVVERLVDAGIPVMGHLGLLPQHVHELSGYRMQAKEPREAEQLIEDARMLETAGAFALVLESIPAGVAKTVTDVLGIPTIGIGAGPYCDGQVLVSYDAFGFTVDSVPPFVKQYADLGESMVAAARAYADDVRQGRFPAIEHHTPAPATSDTRK
ncbi:MAG TPA: 3-methyl-2-oxobutanoate hydroxymethyltransferase [Bryobacteraceae bacterium]|nr:3-methyl-2-oxobutanoate hydroxymethyltransferase [Bryobacteraceae bacterium]